MYPGGVFGSRWMEFKPQYGIHGTNNPASIGTRASLGCVRMHNRDVEELYSKVSFGTTVNIYNSAIDNENPSYDNPSPSENTEQKTYVIKSGDTLWKIAKTHGVSISQLAEINNLSDPNRLHIGQELIIP